MADRRQVGVVVTDGETMPPVSISHRRNSVTTVAANVGGPSGASVKGKREPRELAQGSGGSAMSKAATGAAAGSTSTPAKKAPAKDIRQVWLDYKKHKDEA